jgi:hypothetical protein
MSTTRPFAPDDRGHDCGHDRGRDRGHNRGHEQGQADHSDGPADAHQVRRINLLDAIGVVPLARDFTRQALYEWGWLPAASDESRAAAEDILLVVSELVTNACLHGGGPRELRLHRAAKVLRMEVTDGGSGDPEPCLPHRAGRPGGHGMFIVQRLCLDWGVSRSAEGGPGKTVWAELTGPA